MAVDGGYLVTRKIDDGSVVTTKRRMRLPVVWLLGKTGAGKSSLIRAITGSDGVAVGNGFCPCTKSSVYYDFPDDEPCVRFLDTRGLAEPDYDPGDDIKECEKVSHVLLVVMKVDDLEQSRVVATCRAIKKQGKVRHAIVVHTGVDALSADDCGKAVRYNQDAIEAVWGASIPSVLVGAGWKDGGVDNLKTHLINVLPICACLIVCDDAVAEREMLFLRHRNLVIKYAGMTCTSDALPLAGIVCVPVFQGKMLYELAERFGVEWGRSTFRDFAAALGSGVSIHYVSKFAINQAVKIIPWYGQIVGAASAVLSSFATTYALGKAACYFLHKRSVGEEIDEDYLRDLYRRTLLCSGAGGENNVAK